MCRWAVTCPVASIPAPSSAWPPPARQGPVKAFTIGFDNEDYDETPIATEMAEAAGADQEILRLNADHLYDHFEETLWHTERTIYNTLGVAKFLMSRHVRDVGYKVVLTGEGSDELFGGYPAFRRDMFLHGLDHLSAAGTPRMGSTAGREQQAVQGRDAGRERGRRCRAHRQGSASHLPACNPGWRAAQRVPGLLQRRPGARHSVTTIPGAAIAEQLDGDMLKGRHPLDKAQYVWIKTMLEGQILTWGGDRVDMANSMEARPPFLDHHLAEYAAAHSAVHAHPWPHRKICAARGDERPAAGSAVQAREVCLHGAAGAHRSQEMGGYARPGRSLSSPDAMPMPAYWTWPVSRAVRAARRPETATATQVQLDASINHLLGVQILHEQFVASDIPRRATETASRLGWRP